MLIIPPIGGFLAQPSDIFGIGNFKADLLDFTGLMWSPALMQAGNSFLVSSSSIEKKKKKKRKRAIWGKRKEHCLGHNVLMSQGAALL